MRNRKHNNQGKQKVYSRKEAGRHNVYELPENRGIRYLKSLSLYCTRWRSASDPERGRDDTAGWRQSVLVSFLVNISQGVPVLPKSSRLFSRPKPDCLNNIGLSGKHNNQRRLFVNHEVVQLTSFIVRTITMSDDFT